MGDENWKEEFRQWKPELKPYQIKLLEEGPTSNSQTLLLSDMWLEWKDLAAKRKIKEIAGSIDIEDPWDDSLESCNRKGTKLDEQLLKLDNYCLNLYTILI